MVNGVRLFRLRMNCGMLRKSYEMRCRDLQSPELLLGEILRFFRVGSYG